MNVGELRKLIEGLPDSMPVMVAKRIHKDWWRAELHQVVDKDESDAPCLVLAAAKYDLDDRPIDPRT